MKPNDSGEGAMAHEFNGSEPRRSRSFSLPGSAESSLRRRSLSLSGAVAPRADEDVENESVSQAGDIGDRALNSNRYSDGSVCFLADNVINNGVVAPIPEDALLQSYWFSSHDPAFSNEISPVSPLPSEIVASLSTNAVLHSGDKSLGTKKGLPWSLEYVSCLLHLAVFGILGVLTRYALQKLFGPGLAAVTSDQSILYLDLPSNMVGSFLMGWFGVVFKADITSVSDLLTIGLTTGYLGSLTTFSGWNQKMLDLSVHGHWVFSALGFLLGLFLAAYSLIFGVETAKGFRWLLRRLNLSSRSIISSSGRNWRVDSCERHLAVMLVMVLMLGLLWGLSGVLEVKEFNSGGHGAQLWLACFVGPIGVWIRWFLARLNGRGLGRAGLLKWIPFGTLIANVSAACVMAALAILKKVVTTQTCDTIATGIQFGLLGCLSTVSTFIAEFDAMRQSKHPWRAYAYAMITIVTSFGLGTLIYSVPVWTKGYD
ncbi:fluoride export protein 1 [Malania oleifera]|uniref:fluoride export protein 1 n=1 Tax=Malania oleifera TaxID=397392 RepID=UPI0025AE9945|nr:fluoride export protein 1 [Malania oleifera]XP_057973705.1 fluoride export protein 1 [Malania oleifera]